jgi:hypothetical protein
MPNSPLILYLDDSRFADSVLKLQLDVLCTKCWGKGCDNCLNRGCILTETGQTLLRFFERHLAYSRYAETQPDNYPYGRCPECGNRGISRERRPNGNDECTHGHVYPSRNAINDPS